MGSVRMANKQQLSKRPAEPSESDRGKRATSDPKTGEVSGSGAGIGNPEGSEEDYSSDLSSGSGSERKTGGPSNSA